MKKISIVSGCFNEAGNVEASKGPVICEVFMHPEQFFHPKLGVAVQPDGTMVSPPLEDLSPFLPREVLAENLKVSLNPKSLQIKA